MKVKMIDALPEPLNTQNDSTGSNWNARYEDGQVTHEKMSF